MIGSGSSVKYKLWNVYGILTSSNSMRRSKPSLAFTWSYSMRKMGNYSSSWLRKTGSMSERRVGFSFSLWTQLSTCTDLGLLTAISNPRISCWILTTISSWSISGYPITHKKVSIFTLHVEVLAMLRLRWYRAEATRVKLGICGQWALFSMAWSVEICPLKRIRLNSFTKE